jgi:TP901 family phage tail tape measure protein
MASNNVTIEVDLITRQAQANAEALSGSVLGLSSKMNLIVQAVDLAKAAFDGIVGAISPFVDVVAAATKDAIEFEKALTDIKTISPAADLEKLSKSLLDVSANWGVDKLVAANAQYDIMSSGVTDAADAFKVMEGAAKLAVATGAETSETAKTITAALNAWGMKADDVGQIMDSLAITTQDGVVRMSELGPVFGQVAATAAGAGVSLQELNSGIAALTLGGTPAAQAGTQLKAVIAGLLKPSEDLAKAFEAQAGQSTAAFLKANGLAATLEVLKVVTKGSAEETSRLFGSQEAVAGLLPLITTQSGNFTKSLEKQNLAIKEGGKVTEEMAKIVSESADFRLKQLSSTVDALSTTFGQTFVPVVAEGAKILTEMAQALRDFLKDNEQEMRKVGQAALNMVKDFGEISKSILLSKELKESLSAIKETADSVTKGLFDGWSSVNSMLGDSKVEFSGYIQILRDIQPLVTTLATVLGTVARIGSAIFIEFRPLRALIDLIKSLGDSLLGLQGKIFGFEAAFGKGTSAADDFNKKLIAQENLLNLGKAAFSSAKTATDPLVESYKNIVKENENMLGVMSKREASLKRTSALEGEATAETKKSTKEQEQFNATIDDSIAKDEVFATSRQANAKESSKIIAGALKIIRTEEQKTYDSMVDNLKKVKSQATIVVSALSKATAAFKNIDSDSTADERLKASAAVAESAASVLEKIPGPIGEIGSAIAGLANLAFQIPEIMRGLPAMIEGFITSIPLLITEVLKLLPQMVLGIIESIPSIIKGIVDSLPEIVESLLALLVSPEFYVKVIKALFDAVLEIVDFGSWGAKIWDGLKNAFGVAGQWLLDAGGKIWEGLTAAFYELGAWLAEVGTKIWEGIKAAFELSFEWLWQIGTKIWDGLQYAFEAVFDWLYEVGATIWQGVKDAFGAVWGWLVAAGELIWSGVSAGFRKAGEWLMSAGKSIWDGFVSAASAVWEWIKSIGRAIWDGLSEGLSSVGSFITGSESSTGIPIVGPIIDEVGSWFGFANGGMVPGARSSNDSILNDVVPALLSPGELVIPRSAIAGGMGDIMAFAADAMGTRGPRRMNFASGGMVGATTSSFSRGNNSDVVDRLVSLEAKFDQLGYAIARNTMKTAQVLEQWNYDGLPETRAV